MSAGSKRCLSRCRVQETGEIAVFNPTSLMSGAVERCQRPQDVGDVPNDMRVGQSPNASSDQLLAPSTPRPKRWTDWRKDEREEAERGRGKE